MLASSLQSQQQVPTYRLSVRKSRQKVFARSVSLAVHWRCSWTGSDPARVHWRCSWSGSDPARVHWRCSWSGNDPALVHWRPYNRPSLGKARSARPSTHLRCNGLTVHSIGHKTAQIPKMCQNIISSVEQQKQNALGPLFTPSSSKHPSRQIPPEKL